MLSFIVGLIGLASPFINEWVIQPYRFKRDKGRRIAGSYYAVWHTNTQNPPQTWESCKISQRGKKITYKSLNNEHGFDYELKGEIMGNIISGHWQSKLPNENVSGGAILYCTTRGHIVGFWVGHCKKNGVTWGYWGISTDKKALKKFVNHMQTKLSFTSIDMEHLFD
ncbi:hypothetical protein [Mucilaginibacter sp.]|jgi:hypothetical protein|uniref:hypothetical protein n=1 Tax=Mucilaginibacter sp. TaxID=1882438 RepID=UPI002C5811FE|nr:hypothetical protein [Mucilaginibacter sp.]HTI59293.1 hypothetical protein [Mucilaginibacter sp.]